MRINTKGLSSLGGSTGIGASKSPTSPSSPLSKSLPRSPQGDRFDAQPQVGTGGSRWWDRHRPGLLNNPQIQRPDGKPQTVANIVPQAQWHNVAKQRIGELFLTQGGLPGHQEQVQGLFNQLGKATKNGQISQADARRLLASLPADFEKSLGRAGFNVPQQELKAPGLGTMFFGKEGAKNWAFFQPE